MASDSRSISAGDSEHKHVVKTRKMSLGKEGSFQVFWWGLGRAVGSRVRDWTVG